MVAFTDTEIRKISQISIPYILHIHHPEPGFLGQFGEYSLSRDQGAGEGSVIDLLHAATGAAGLEDDQVRLFLFRQLHGFFGTFAEGFIHGFAVSVCDGAVDDFRRRAGCGKAAQDFRADGNDGMAGKETEKGFVPVVSAVVFSVVA